MPTVRVQHYAELLAAVLAAQGLSNRATADADARTNVVKLLEPVAERLDQLNDHQGRLAQLGAGNIAGQTALDMSQAAIRSWLQRLKLGARIDAEELVTRFRAGAEAIRFLSGERDEAPTLSAFDQASRGVAAGVGALVLAPGLIALVGEEVPLLAFAGRLAAQRVFLWALANPAAALAASEALLGFGLQIGEEGWEPFWDQLRDPRGRWFIITQVLLDYMYIKSGMSGHAAPARNQRGNRPLSAVGVEPAPASGDVVDIAGARERVRNLRAVVRQVHDGAVEEAAPSELHVDAASSRGSGVDHATSTKVPATRPRREAGEQPQRATRTGGRYGVLDDPTADILNDPEPTPDVQQLREGARAAHPDDIEGQRDYIWKRLKSGAVRTALLARGPTETKAVSRVLQEFGVKEATPAAVGEIFKYLFDSSGISFSYENYVSWTRLAQGRARITDARFIVHELSEVGLLKRDGIDFMGQSHRVGTETHERWASKTFDPAYARAHKQALRVEYDFLAEQLARVRGGDERVKPEVVAAVASTFDENSAQACGLME
ncbi:MAG: hypothetical protein ACREBE_20420, partial [bacterium]